MKLILHTGYPKTGSSTLQFGLFNQREQENNLNLLLWRKNDPEEPLEKRPSSCLFNYQDIEEKYLALSENKVNILSDESMTAPIRLRRQNFGTDIRSPFDFPKELKKQVVSRYGENVDFKVFVTIRNQSKLIFSQYVEEYNWKLFKDIDLLFDDAGNIDLSGYEIYDFYKYVLTLHQVFGEDTVVIAFFEDWLNEFDSFAKTISTTFNIALDEVKELLKKNHVNSKVKLKDGVFSKEERVIVPYLSDEQNETIMQQYYDSNKNLARLLGLEEKFIRYGYIK